MSDKSLQSVQDVIRTPFYQYENSSRGYGKDSFLDQVVINMIPEKAQDFDTQTVKQQLSKRPGFTSDGTDLISALVADISACTIRDFIQITAVYDVFVAAIFDSSINAFFIVQLRPITGSSLLIAELTSKNTADDIYLTEISQSVSGSLLPGVAFHWVKSDLTSSSLKYATTTSGVFTNVSNTVTDTSFPANQTPALITTGRVINQRGTFYVATLDGQIFNSYPGQNDINAWSNATSQIGSIKTDIYPDQLLGIERYKNNIVAFSRNSIEFFNEVGPSVNNPSSLAAIDQAFIKFGALKPDLIRNIDDTLYWVAYGADGQAGLWMLSGYTPVKLSTPYVDSMITYTAGNLNSYQFRLSSCVMNGKRQIFINGVVIRGMLQLTDSNSFDATDTYTIDTINDSKATSIVYNVEDKTWWGFNIGETSTTTPFFATSFASPSQGGLYSQYALLDSQGPNLPYIYSLRTDNVYSDDSPALASIFPIVAYAQTNPLWFGNEKRKRISKFKVITNTVPTRASGDTNDYNLYLVYTKDNIVEPNVSGYINTIVRKIEHPHPQGRYTINNLGMGRVWNFAILDKSPMNLRLDTFELDIQQGSH